MEYKELCQYVDELFEDDCARFINTISSKEEKYTKNLYTGFLIGHWNALTPEKKKGFVEHEVRGSNGGHISWWLHVARGLIELEGLKGISTEKLPEKKIDLTKVNFLEINRVCANPS